MSVQKNRLLQSQRAYRILRQCNKEIFRAADEASLIHEICRIIVEEGGYLQAGVDFLKDDENRTAGATAPAGKDASSISIPLKNNGRSYGALNITASGADAFDDQEVRLMMDLADNLAHGLSALRTQATRRRTEQELCRTLEILRKTYGATIQAINMIIESRDPYTTGHQRRVSDLARAIATEMSLSRDMIDGIRIAGQLHDLGKLSVPSEILSKPCKLTKAEFDLIKSHPQVAYDILSTIEFPWPIADIILQHHERVNGSGYPRSLSADDILIEARILGVADVVEAMISHRPYRPAHPLEEALHEISQNSGILYDAQVTEVCVRLFKEKHFSFRFQPDAVA